MTCLRYSEYGSGRFVIPHFANENDIRVLPEHIFQSSGKRAGIAAKLTLSDGGLVIGVNIFDRVFDGNYAATLKAVQMVNHSAQSGRFPAAGRPAHYHQSSRLEHEFFTN